MGIFSSSSKTKQVVTTSTVTNTQIRDIGLTGQSAVSALRTLGELEVARSAAWRDAFTQLSGAQAGSPFGGSLPLIGLLAVATFLLTRRGGLF